MHCPQCGQQQAPEVVRFCSRCGFPLDGVIQLLANEGLLPSYAQVEGTKEISPRRRGVRQGGILLLTGILLVSLLGVLSSFSNSNFLELLTAIAAILCFVGGPLRMIYAALFEEGGRSWPGAVTPHAGPMPLHGGAPARNALPAPQPRQAPGWSQRPRTAELARPPTVTEGTTRLLDKDKRGDR
jgi:hypothetical protein